MPSEEDLLAAESLHFSAFSLGYSPTGTPARASRLVTLANYAHKLAPSDERVAWVLSNIYETQGDPSAAAEMTRFRLMAQPDDFSVGLRYFQLCAAARPRPDDTAAFLNTAVSDEKLSAPLRAQAATELARLMERLNDKTRSAELFAKALELDGLNSGALQASLSSGSEKLDTVGILKVCVKWLRGNPRYIQVIKDVGDSLAQVGLSQQAAAFYQCLWGLIQDTSKESKEPPLDLAKQYMTILLDAGQAEQAIKLFEPLLAKYPKDTALVALIVEAYRDAGQGEKADRIMASLTANYEAMASGSPLSTDQASELAWFYTLINPKGDTALVYAKQVAQQNSSSPAASRLLGYAEVLSGQGDLVSTGQELLNKQRDTDPWSAVLLAESYAAAGNADAAKNAILHGLTLGRTGTPSRRLMKLAKQQKVDVPPMANAQAMGQVLEEAGTGFLDMASYPENYLSITLLPAADKVLPGDPLEVEAVLTNKGKLDVSLGEWGLINPVMGLQATSPLTKERFNNLPMVNWPAPKYLAPGQSVRATVRIDVANLGTFLAKHPLEDLTLTVTGLVDPQQSGLDMASSLPTLSVEPLTLTRRNLLGAVDPNDPAQWAKGYQYALRVIVTDLVRGDIPSRMQAARRIGSLMAMARDAESGKIKLPTQLYGVVNKQVLLALVQRTMKDSSPVVRAELLTALQNARLDEATFSLLSPAASDSSPLVRLRLAELLSVSRLPRQEAVLNSLAQDSDPFVQQMAGAGKSSPSR
jgi:predicted Zn-dependent protease